MMSLEPESDSSGTGGLDAAEQFLAEMRWRFEHDAWKIRRCLEQLQDEELTWRPNDVCNSVASIVVHICGSTDQWISAIAGKDTARNRSAEFIPDSEIGRQALLSLLENSVKLASDTLAKLTPAVLKNHIVIQGFDNSVLTALYCTERHQAEHIGQITYITKLKRGKAFESLWVPANEAQAASPYQCGFNDPRVPESEPSAETSEFSHTLEFAITRDKPIMHMKSQH